MSDKDNSKKISFKRTGAVTLPTYSFKKRTVAYIKSLSKIYEGQVIQELDKKTGELVDKPPAKLMKIVDLETMRLCEMIVPTLLTSTFTEKMNNEHIDMCFEICVTADVLEGKKYKGVEVYNIDEPPGTPTF